MRSRAYEKKRDENRREYRLWRQWRRERVNQLLAGPYGPAAHELLGLLKNLPTATTLLNTIAAGPWCSADSATRSEVLGLVDAAIVKHREQMGMAPFDGAIPGQTENAFLRIRALLACD